MGRVYLPGDLGNQSTAKLIDSIVTGTEYTGPAFTSACFFNQHQIEPFLREFELEKLHIFGQEGILAFSEHAMYIGRKMNNR